MGVVIGGGGRDGGGDRGGGGGWVGVRAVAGSIATTLRNAYFPWKRI